MPYLLDWDWYTLTWEFSYMDIKLVSKIQIPAVAVCIFFILMFMKKVWIHLFSSPSSGKLVGHSGFFFFFFRFDREFSLVEEQLRIQAPFHGSVWQSKANYSLVHCYIISIIPNISYIYIYIYIYIYMVWLILMACQSAKAYFMSWV